ncbi:hypothetical protein QL285_039009 [Trifolium repens]|nr:hypothetical protein QL285_039009 [Trifolium repens]
MSALLVAKNGLQRKMGCSSSSWISKIMKSAGNTRSSTFTKTSSTVPAERMVDWFANTSSRSVPLVVVVSFHLSARDNGITLTLEPTSHSALTSPSSI